MSETPEQPASVRRYCSFCNVNFHGGSCPSCRSSMGGPNNYATPLSETPEMVDRVARALFAADYPNETWGRFGPSEADAARYHARAIAAIEAMREPTRAMEKAGDDCATPFGDASPAFRVFNAMIDAALAQPTSSTA